MSSLRATSAGERSKHARLRVRSDADTSARMENGALGVTPSYTSTVRGGASVAGTQQKSPDVASGMKIKTGRRTERWMTY